MTVSLCFYTGQGDKLTRKISQSSPWKPLMPTVRSLTPTRRNMIRRPAAYSACGQPAQE